MKYKLAIFDLDGTVLDTLEDLYDSVNFALREHKLPERSISRVRDFVGNGIRKLIDLSVPEGTDIKTTDSVFSCFTNHYKNNNCNKTKPYDGITELLTSLQKEGIHTAIVSNKADFAVKSLVDKYFPQLISYKAGEKEGIPRKPSPQAIFNAMDFFDVKPSDTVYIGDSEVDIETAANAGIDSIIVTWGFRDRDRLISSGAEIAADDIASLKNLIF